MYIYLSLLIFSVLHMIKEQESVAESNVDAVPGDKFYALVLKALEVFITQD